MSASRHSLSGSPILYSKFIIQSFVHTKPTFLPLLSLFLLMVFPLSITAKNYAVVFNSHLPSPQRSCLGDSSPTVRSPGEALIASSLSTPPCPVPLPPIRSASLTDLSIASLWLRCFPGPKHLKLSEPTNKRQIP